MTETRYDLSLKGMPRDLMTRVIEKCRRQMPPVSAKWKIVELLTKWIEEPDAKPRKTSPPKIRP